MPKRRTAGSDDANPPYDTHADPQGTKFTDTEKQTAITTLLGAWDAERRNDELASTVAAASGCVFA